PRQRAHHHHHRRSRTAAAVRGQSDVRRALPDGYRPARPDHPHRGVPRVSVVDEHGLAHPQGTPDPAHHWRCPMTPIILLVGATIGAGLFLLIRATVPSQPALSSAVERLTATPEATRGSDVELEGFEERLGAWAER